MKMDMTPLDPERLQMVEKTLLQSIVGYAFIPVYYVYSYLIFNSMYLLVWSMVPLWYLANLCGFTAKRKCGKKKRVLLVSDVAETQICGVLRKYHQLQIHLAAQGFEVYTLDPEEFISVPMPVDKNVRFVVPSPMATYTIISKIQECDADMTCLMVEGPLGTISKLVLELLGRPYNTMYCTQMDIYMTLMLGSKLVGNDMSKRLAWFHSGAEKVISPSHSASDLFVRKGTVRSEQAFPILNGCDTKEFSMEGPRDDEMDAMKRPIWLYVGRVSFEKNVIPALNLSNSLPGTVCVVGKGTYFEEAKRKYRDVKFLGWKEGSALAASYRTADVFVFPSLTDTFGQVMVEAMASGLPVAAYPAVGVIDVVKHGMTGAISTDLAAACIQALQEKNAAQCVEHAKSFDWGKMTAEFVKSYEYEPDTTPAKE